MRQAVLTLSVLAIISFAFSTAVALGIAATIAPADPAPDAVIPAVIDGAISQCPAMPDGATPRCPAFEGAGPSVQTVIDAARRAGCPAFSRDIQEAVDTTTRDRSTDPLTRS